MSGEELENQVKEIGLIAEDLQDLGFSSLINIDDEGIADYVHYDKLSIYNIKMIQMQQERINQLENRLAALES
jgi:predicted NUDIX family phosphoesterase